MKNKLNCVLVIDDDEPTNFLTQMILEESGWVNHIRIAQNGPEALAYLSKCASSPSEEFPSPDLILLDINMPAMDGWEFLEEYKKLGKAERIIIVMLTTSLFPEDKRKAERMEEISGFENKPFTMEKFKVIMESYFTSKANAMV
jgi:CheY-like chemotaxis protein